MRYLLIESQDPFASRDVEGYLAMAESLVLNGDEVTLFLVQNGVLPARCSSESGRLMYLSAEGVTILADDFSLRERGIIEAELVEGVRAAPLDRVIDEMVAGAKTLWH